MTESEKLENFAKTHGFDPQTFTIEHLIDYDRQIRLLYSELNQQHTNQSNKLAQQIAEQRNKNSIKITELKSMTIEQVYNLIK